MAQGNGSEKIIKILSNVVKIFSQILFAKTIKNNATSIYFAIIVLLNISQIFKIFLSLCWFSQKNKSQKLFVFENYGWNILNIGQSKNFTAFLGEHNSSTCFWGHCVLVLLILLCFSKLIFWLSFLTNFFFFSFFSFKTNLFIKDVTLWSLFKLTV